ncbi:hypothetical protein [Acidiphilium acidophilum]|uniref:Rhodopsin n=1 Tax=Acidiphilium acidophilum TaxID=76588 RepID=A0AAW9DRT6_ACIAO|nr:hypothetical protein [Acidiphilium acidophilum]MDX5931425.1 hypothetical protein [Acidiphilium acidophilum]GBR75798.1 hypothetical protein AA700_0510 [Acidiphilium acidophilum DSM 700]
MDIQTIDSQYSQLQTQAQGTVEELKALATKLQTSAQSGNQDAREWLLDLKSIALAIQAEQNQVANLLQALHGFMANQPQQMGSVPQSQQPWGQPQQQGYPPQGYPQQGYPPQQQGGILGGFLNSGFGRAITMGAGFGIGDSIINDIF